MFISIVTAIIVILLDQYIKYLTVTHLEVGESSAGIEGFFDFFYIQNDGAGFGLFSGQMWLFYAITILIVGYLFYLVYKHRRGSWFLLMTYGFLIGGALGNFIDRLHLGYVIDMFRLSFMEFPIFNVADISLTVGVILLIIIIFISDEEEDIL